MMYSSIASVLPFAQEYGSCTRMMPEPKLAMSFRYASPHCSVVRYPVPYASAPTDGQPSEVSTEPHVICPCQQDQSAAWAG
jgi:hypothetical protein